MRASRVVALLLMVGVVALAPLTPATAHHKPGHDGGPGSQCDQPKKYPPPQCRAESASVDDGTVTRGQRITFYGQGYKTGEPVTLSLDSTRLDVPPLVPDEFAFVTTPLTIPATAAVGDHNLVASGLGADGEPLSLAVPITVLGNRGVIGGIGGGEASGPDAVAGGGGGSGGLVAHLPRSGVDALILAAAGAVLVGGGAAAIVAGRRRGASMASGTPRTAGDTV